MVIKASGHTWGAGERPEFIDHYFGMRAEANKGGVLYRTPEGVAARALCISASIGVARKHTQSLGARGALEMHFVNRCVQWKNAYNKNAV